MHTTDIDAELQGMTEHWERTRYVSLLPFPASDAHKYSRGHLLVVAGSEPFPGAAILTAKAAARSGAGYVTLCVPHSALSTARSHLISVPVEGYQDDEGAFSEQAVEALVQRIDSCDAVVIGPGLTVTAGTRLLVETVIRDCEKPLLIDADALAIAAYCREDLLARERSGRATVVTPHVGEMRKLLAGIDAPVSFAESPELRMRIDAAQLVSCELGVTVVFKGPSTVIAQRDRVVVNASGTPALATAGTGDVLSGVIGALLAQDVVPFEAAALGVYWHGHAGEVAAQRKSEICVIAEDVVESLGEAVIALSTMEERE